MRNCSRRNGRVSLLGFCLLIGVLLAGMAIGVVLSAVLPLFCETTVRGLSPSYTSSALIRVAMSPEGIAPGKNQLDARDYEIFKNTQSALVKSPYVLTAALRKRDISLLEIVKREKDPLSWLENALQVGYIDNSEIMRVSLTAADAHETAELVNAVVDAYIAEVVNKEEQLRRGAVAQLTQIYNIKENEIRRKRENLDKLAAQLKISGSEAAKTQAKLEIQELYNLRAELIELQNNLGKANADLKAAQAKLARLEKTPVSEIELAALVQSDPVCIKQLEIIADLQKKLNEKKRNDLTEEEKDEIARLTDQLNTTERDFEVRKNELRELMKNSRRAEIEENIAAAEVQTETLARRKSDLEKQVHARNEQLPQYRDTISDIEMMTAEISRLEKSLAEIAAQRDKLDIEAMARPRITIENEAVPERK